MIVILISDTLLQEENDEMMAVAVNPATNTIQYELFINQLMVRQVKPLGNSQILTFSFADWLKKCTGAARTPRKSRQLIH